MNKYFLRQHQENFISNACVFVHKYTYTRRRYQDVFIIFCELFQLKIQGKEVWQHTFYKRTWENHCARVIKHIKIGIERSTRKE